MKEKKQPGRVKSTLLNWLGVPISLTNGDFFQEWFGTSSSGKVVTADKAIALSAVWACVRLLSESVSTLPMKVYQREPDGSRKLAQNHPAYQLLCRRPNTEMTPSRFMLMVVASVCLRGNAFVEKKMIGNKLVSLVPLLPQCMVVKRLDSGELEYTFNAALLSTGVADGVVEPQRLPGIDALPKQRLFIRDLIAPGRTSAPAIFWVQQTGFTNAAKVVPEGTAKPYSDIEFATQITPVTTIAHMFKASKQILDDFAQLQSTVDAEMRYGLKYVEEQEILFGDGTGAHLKGIVPQASAFAAEFTVDQQNGIDDLRLAMLQAQLARFPASGHVLHFIDWAKIELTKDTLGRYILANPSSLTGPTLWGLPVVATETAAFQGKFLTGAFNAAAQLFDREDANVVISTENADDFEKNMISIRCEERLALAVKRPEAFIYGSFTVPSAG